MGAGLSIHHENMAWEHDLPGLKKLVLLAVSRNANLSSLEGRISAQKLALQCGISESAARKFTDELERDGFITRVRVPTRGIQYRLNLERLGAA